MDSQGGLFQSLVYPSNEVFPGSPFGGSGIGYLLSRVRREAVGDHCLPLPTVAVL